MEQSFNPFRLSLQPNWLARSLEKLLSLEPLAKHYDNRPNQNSAQPSEHVDEFLDHTLGALGAKISVDNPEALKDIPAEGPLVFVANHPFGGLEGVAMSQLLRQYRPDLKVLTNELLTRIPEFGDLFIGVDILSKQKDRKNLQGIRTVVRHLQQGGAVLIYPSGVVSAINTQTRRIEDSEWYPFVGNLVQRTKATCVPFYVRGRNSLPFYLAGLVHRRLRTLMLPRELANSAKKSLALTVGQPISRDDMAALETDTAITRYLRTATDLLAHQQDSQAELKHRFPPLESPEKTEKQQLLIQQKLESLSHHKLLTYKNFDVYCVPYQELGPMMEEIAVTRERTFRAAGEGTGHDLDSDHFDPHYLQLFIWDTKTDAIVGGYRIGRVDEIVKSLGVKGLYSRSLYHFEESYIEQLGQALEVGRSFVSPEYQRHPRALDLLWQGIGAYVALNPGYHTLFGCVSISKEHSSWARAFIKDSLMHSFRAEQEYLNNVRPLAPLKVRNQVWTDEVLGSLSNIVLINKLLGQCDPGKTIPVLLRQYLALNGRFVGFSVNHGFNDALDGLILVDLRKTPVKYLRRYLGKDGSEQFIELWRLNYASA